MVNVAFNVDSPKGYAGAVGRAADSITDRRLLEVPGVRPKQVYEAILKT